nr:hypothetical protein [Tanacetum cinerariifolium]
MEKGVAVIEDVIRQALHLDDANGVECLPNEEIFTELARMGYEKPPPKLTFYKAFFSAHGSRKFNFSQYIFDSMVRNVDNLSKFLMYPRFLQVIINAQVDDMSSHNNQYISSALTQKVFANMRRVDPIPTPLQAQPATPSSPTPKQPTETSESSIPLLNTLLETCATLSQKVTELEHDKHTQALEILKLKKRVKKLKKKEKSRSSGLKRLRKVGTSQRVESSNDTIVDAQEDGMIDDVNAAEPNVLDDEEIDWNVFAEQTQEKHIDNIMKYQSLKKKPISIAQARKHMIIYLKNMAGYKMEHFRGMTYEKVRPIFEREYNKVKTLFKPDKDVEEPQKKRVAEETLLQESFKKLKAIEVSGSVSTQETPSNDPKEISEEDVHNMLEIVLVTKFKGEALQVKYPLIDWEIYSEGSRSYWKIIRVGRIIKTYQSFKYMLKGFDKEDLVALWSLVKEKHDIFMLTEKDYPLSNAVMIMMLSSKLQVEEDSEMARDLVIKIFMEANKPKSRSLDTPPIDQDEET